jgi:hypothetical protein
MLHPRVLLASATVLLGCAHAPPSRWEMNGKYTVCTCDGVERQPTPGEADGFRDGERVDLYCEGKVGACHPGRLGNPKQPNLDD